MKQKFVLSTVSYLGMVVLFTGPVYAASSSNVSITNTVNSTNSTSSTSNTQTHIRIESNGQVKTYDSDQPGSVNIQTDDGKAQVHINSVVGNTSTVNTTDTATPIQTKPSPITDRPKIAGAKTSNLPAVNPIQISQNQTFFDQIRLFFHKLFSHFSSNR
jgi:hypothetical protein